MKAYAPLVIAACSLFALAGRAEDAVPEPIATCGDFAAKINACVPGAAYDDQAVDGCALDLGQQSAVCQRLAALLIACENKLSCTDFLSRGPKACASRDRAYTTACGERAISPATQSARGESPLAGPSFHSMGFHVRAARTMYGKN